MSAVNRSKECKYQTAWSNGGTKQSQEQRVNVSNATKYVSMEKTGGLVS